MVVSYFATRYRYLTASFAYDRSAIMRAAWAMARTSAKAAATLPHPFRRQTTARAELANALVRVWDSAKGERALAIWAAERDAGAAAEAARRAALPDRDRRIEDAQLALMCAEHADSFTAANNAAVVAARAQIAALLMGA